MDKWAHLGHSLNECWWHEPLRIAYVNIPKNASSYTKGCLMGSDHTWVSCHLPDDVREFLVVLRDPIDRWVSGMAQYQLNSNRPNLSLEEIFETVTFDDHTELQTFFLQNVDFKHTTFLYVDSTFEAQLGSWMLGKGFITENILNNYEFANRASEDHRVFMKNGLKEVLENNAQYVQKLRNHFAADYDLIATIKRGAVNDN